MQTPLRALEEAYQAVVAIKTIEDNHFGGNRISPEAGSYSQSVQAYFQGELRKNLTTAKTRLAEFKATRSLLQDSNRPITEINLDAEPTDETAISVINQPSVILRKLKFIDEVLSRYNAQPANPPGSMIIVSQPAMTEANGQKPPERNRSLTNQVRATSSTEDVESLVDKTGVLPRSILKTVDRIKRELDPQAEEEVVENFRNSKARTIVSLRLVLILIIVPLLTQQIAKNFLIGPIVDRIRAGEQVEIFLNVEMEEEAFAELHRFEERLHFQTLLGETPAIAQEETSFDLEEQLRTKALELRNKYGTSSNNAIKNVFADAISVAVFIVLLLNSREEIAVLKSFIDELVYGLSDSAKAFIIILFTDVFVGFHSPHGWEVILEGLSRHFGLPANRSFIFLFIATFPVILDTIFKYWIFRYLNRISPSAVATYRNMNE